jgi:hypothetical protein
VLEFNPDVDINCKEVGIMHWRDSILGVNDC